MTFKIKSGQIEFTKSGIEIQDGQKKYFWIRLVTVLFWIGFASFNLNRELREPQFDYFWIGINALLLVMNLTFLILTAFQSRKHSIAREEIVYIRMKERFNDAFMDVKLTDGKLRRVTGVKASFSAIDAYVTKQGWKQKDPV